MPLKKPPAILWVTILFVCWTLYWVWPWPMQLDYGVPETMHWWDAYLNSWIIGEVRHNILSGTDSLFDSRAMYPSAGVLTLSENMLFPAIATLPFGHVNPLLVHNIFILISLAATAVCTWIWLRMRGLGVLPAVFGALLFAYAPFRLATIVKLQLVAAMFIPLFLIGLKLFLERPSTKRTAALILVALAQLGTCLYYSIYLFLIIGPVALLGLFRARKTFANRHGALQLIGGAGILLMTIWLVFSPYIRVKEDMGLQRDDRERIKTSGTLKDIWTTSPLNAVDKARTPTLKRRSIRERVSYPGLMLIMAGIVGAILLLKRGKEQARAEFGAGFHLYLIVIAMALFFGSGPSAPFGSENSPYTFLVEKIPVLDGLRYSVRFMVFAALGLAYFAAQALHIIMENLQRHVAIIVACLVISIGAFEIRAKPLPLSHLNQEPALNEALAGRKGAVISLPIRERHRKRIMKSFGSLTHGRPTINGYTGFEPPFASFIQDHARKFPYKGSKEAFQKLGITTVVMAADNRKVKKTRRQKWLEEPVTVGDWLIFNVKDADVKREAILRQEVASFRSPVLPTERLVPKKNFQVISKYHAEDLSHMFDGDPSTRWSPRRKQKRGTLWLELRFSTPENLSALWLDTTKFPADIPRGYRIMGRVAGETKWQLLVKEPNYLPVAQLAAAPAKALHRLKFPATQVEAIRFVSTSSSRYHWLSIGELHVERAQ